MGRFSMPDPEQAELLRSEGIDPTHMMVQLADEGRMILRNLVTGTDIVLYFSQKLKS